MLLPDTKTPSKPACLELTYFFSQQQNLHNVEVLGLPDLAEDTLSSLLKEVTTRLPGSWMVDKLIMPEPKDHQQWTRDLGKLQNHMGAKNHLWITCAGIQNGKAEHF